MDDRTGRAKKVTIQAAKMAAGGGLGICAAELMGLNFAASAGSIALLTLMTTKWETVRLSLFRLVTFAIATVLAWGTFSLIQSRWAAYAVFVFLLVLVLEAVGKRAAIAVNSVIGTHFLSAGGVTRETVRNELLLVLTGVTIALMLNLLQDYGGYKKRLARDTHCVETRFQQILLHLAVYLCDVRVKPQVWQEIRTLKESLHTFLQDAYEYQENTFRSHPGYYIGYLKMREGQLSVLENLHMEIQNIRTMPRQADAIAGYMLYLKEYVVEIHMPAPQLERLRQLLNEMKKEPLPKDRDEFENRARLYHILKDLEEFVLLKKKFVENLDTQQRIRYWEKKKNKNISDKR